MGFLDSLNNKNKLGKYSLESDKVEIIKIKEVLKEQEECLWFISSSVFNRIWIVSVTNMRLILVRKKLNKELEIKSFFIDEINEIDVQKGSLLSKLVLKMNNANIEFSNVENLYLDKFLELLNTQINARPKELSKRQAEKQYEKERLEQLKRDKIPYCPKCHSTSLTYQNKKLSIGRAVTGGVLLGGVGAVVGGLSSKKGYVKCLNCGHKWKL
ncbi:MAG: PH domain-containing protein [Clostridium perfringens]|uniref:PH domain-containing protein n=1 Tax=Clostridium TaxID=1485 RepID=UPI001A25968D|nr:MULTISPECIES: PH domain-containing protein [Clostridium]ELC8385728.1 PH domain-containing protein [Clostridium perfringens]MDH2470483.1 PH domain-containing protein [Clostridium perfringens]MDM0664788.1 PH domain-containing protein [Clostridium perfringens]MDU5775794.1 PH domain-containing protein [Clostridium perfringens]MDU6274088.1 PH domain-containing protein [Clostridium sp.]